MNPPGRGFTHRGSPRTFTPPHSSHMNQFSNSTGYYSPNSSPGMFSPRHTPRGNFTPRHIHNGIRFQGNYSPISSTSGYCGDISQEYSPNDSPFKYPLNSSPLHQQAGYISFNSSMNSSDFEKSGQSMDSSFDCSPRTPHNRNKRQRASGRNGPDINNYIHPSMLEDPWAELTVKMNRNSQSTSFFHSQNET